MKYREDYQIDRILGGREDPVIRERAAAAPFDERIRLLAMLNGALSKGFRAVVREEEILGLIYESLVRIRDGEDIAAVREEAENLSNGSRSSADRKDGERSGRGNVLRSLMR